jgi:transcriptional regulator with XRE-family HTH domain
MAGRPTLYKPEYVEKVKRICLLGGTDAQIADYFGVDVSTIGNWKNAHPEFLESIRETKVLQDLEVSDSLFKQARSGNVIAQKFWLMNRQKDAWREKQEVDLRTPDGIQLAAIDATRLAGLTDEQIAETRETMRRALEIAQQLQIEPK